MALFKVSCDDLTSWYKINGTLSLDTENKVEGSASVKLTVSPGSWYEAIAQYAVGPAQAVDLTTEPIIRLRLNPSLISSIVYIQIIIITGDAFDQYNYGTVPLNMNVFNAVDIDLRTITDPTFDITKVRGFTVRYYLSASGATPTVNIDAVESLSGLPDIHITGKVTDESIGLPLAGVTIKAGTYTTTTVSDGTYDLLVSSGIYTVEFSKTGYRSKTINNVNATIDTVLNVALTPLPPQVILTIETSPIDGGTTSPEVGSYSADVGSNVKVTATPSTDYIFNNWLRDGVNVGSANPFTILMDTDHTLTAVFTALPKHTLTINSSPVQGIPFSLEKVS